MTAEQAINELKFDRGLYESEIVSAGDGSPDGDLMLALDMGIAALEKQISKKPKKHGYGKWYFCPDCLRLIKKRIEDSPHDIKFYPFCGQALDWSEE